MAYYTGPSYGPKDGMAYTAVMPKDGFQYKYGEDGTRYSVPIFGKPTTPDGGGKIAKNSDPATDQEIRDAGFKYVPKQKYLQDPFNLSTPPPPPPPDGGITNTNAFNNSGNDGFSVYNPDPNTISNQNYRPNYDYRRFSEPDQSMIEMGRNQDYFYKPPPSKLQGLMSMIPGAGIARFLGNQIGGMLPTNRRGIFENELAGQGVMVNNIGQIVQGDGAYDDVSGRNVMAGYNPEKMTAKTFDDRIAEATLKMDDDGPYKQKRLDALEAAKANFLKTQKKANKIYDFEEEEKEKKKKDTIVGRYLTEKKETKAAKEAEAAQAVKLQKLKDAKAATYYTPDGTSGGGAGQGIDISNAGTQRNEGNNFQGDSGPTTQQESDYGYGSDFGFAGGGRAGYFFGGRVNYKIGGVVHPDGRKGFFKGAQADTSKGESMSPGTDASGGFRGGDNDGGASDNPPVTVVNNNPIDISTVTKSVGDYEIPYGVEALLANRGKFKAVINPDEILDKNLGAEFTYDNGPFSIGAYADMDGDKSLNANYTRNNSNYSFDLNDDGGQLKFTRTFANGGLAGLL